MNELRADHERQMYEVGQSNNIKMEQLQVRLEADKKRI